VHGTSEDPDSARHGWTEIDEAGTTHFERGDVRVRAADLTGTGRPREAWVCDESSMGVR
jgi:hypothetical protein